MTSGPRVFSSLSLLDPAIAFALAGTLAAAISPIAAQAQTTSTWTNTSSASAGWQNSGNWNNGVPNAVGSAASIIADITAPQTITLDGAVVLGSLTIGDPTASGASSYTINAGTYSSGSSTLAGTLTFDVTSGSATLSPPWRRGLRLTGIRVKSRGRRDGVGRRSLRPPRDQQIGPRSRRRGLPPRREFDLGLSQPDPIPIL